MNIFQIAKAFAVPSEGHLAGCTQAAAQYPGYEQKPFPHHPLLCRRKFHISETDPRFHRILRNGVQEEPNEV